MLMPDSSYLDRLTRELSREERQEILTKIAHLFDDEQAPVHPPEEDPLPVNLEREYSRLSWMTRLLIMLQVIFRSASRIELIETRIMRDIARETETVYPGLYDHTQGTVRRSFLVEVQKLRQSLQVFAPAVRGLTQRRKEEVFALLIHRELPHVEQQILHNAGNDHASETSAESLAKMEKERLRGAYGRLEDLLENLAPEERELLAQAASSLGILTEFIDFPYEKVSLAFGGGRAAITAAENLKESLFELTRLFHGLGRPPATSLLEALFLLAEPAQEFNPQKRFQQLAREMEQARDAFAAIRRFHDSVPLYNLLRLASGKVNIFFKPFTGGGEEWRVSVRAYYKRMLRGVIRRSTISARHGRCVVDALGVLGKERLTFLPHYRSSQKSVGLRAVYKDSAAFLREFIGLLFSRELNPPLKQVLIDGEFYKEQNSTDYSESYNGLRLLGEALDETERYLSSAGNEGRRNTAMAAKTVPQTGREKRMAMITLEADDMIRPLLYRGQELLQGLASVLHGILYGEKGGRYDTLSNLGYIGGRRNEELMRLLEEGYARIDAAQAVLTELLALEEEYQSAP